MKGLEKLTAIRLAEVLSQKGVVPTDAITDALYTQDQYGEPFVEVMVSSEHISEWDLARVVVEHFQLPFILAGNYDLSPETLARLPEQVLFEGQLVLLDAFDRILTVVMPIMTPFETLDKIQRKHDCELFPYVGLPSENRRVLQESFPSYKQWEKKAAEERDRRRAARSKKRAASNDWMNIFDSADAAVRQGMKGPEG